VGPPAGKGQVEGRVKEERSQKPPSLPGGSLGTPEAEESEGLPTKQEKQVGERREAKGTTKEEN